MNPAVKSEWVAALRSGDYEQGKHQLRRGDSFCCLGVLCDLAVKAGVPLQVETNVDGTTWYDNEKNYLPHAVCEWAGLESNEPVIAESGGEVSLIRLNDNGYGFWAIADVIEHGEETS